jgi:KDO2-lipid IV(A) lauroyltransferase
MQAMKELGYRLQYLALELLSYWFNRLPLANALEIGAALGEMAYFLGIRREVALNNLSHSLPGNTDKENRGIAGRLYRNLGRNLAELLRFNSLTCQDIKNAVELKGIEVFDRVLAEGRGGILVSGHYGNWEMYAAAIACYGYPFSVVVYPQHNLLADEKLNALRRSKNIEVIYKREAAREVLQALRRNRFVTMLADQDAGKEGAFVDFLGRQASVTKGPAVFAVKTGAPIISGVIVRQEGGKHIGYIDQPLYAQPGPDKETEILRLTGLFTARLEEYIRQRPDHWYWVHKRWKTRPVPGV